MELQGKYGDYSSRVVWRAESCLPHLGKSGSLKNMKVKPHFLMCQPKFYRIAYEINPWMNINNPADPSMAYLQWKTLYDLIRDLGGEVSLIEPVEGLPDMVFTANAGLVYEDKVILGRFRHGERRGEERYYERWFSDRGYHCHRLPGGISFEGEGDTVFLKDILLLGHGFRTDIRAHPYIGAIMNREYRSLKLVDPHFYHLDTCLLFLEDIDLIIYYPDAFDPESAKTIEGLPCKVLRLSKEDAYLFVCNSICIGMNLILSRCTKAFYHEIEGYGINTIGCDTSEFMKSGGGIRCMVLHLSRYL